MHTKVWKPQEISTHKQDNLLSEMLRELMLQMGMNLRNSKVSSNWKVLWLYDFIDGSGV